MNKVWLNDVHICRHCHVDVYGATEQSERLGMQYGGARNRGFYKGKDIVLC